VVAAAYHRVLTNLKKENRMNFKKLFAVILGSLVVLGGRPAPSA
jgi:hypothetical protein